jgi:hypothetical protein
MNSRVRYLLLTGFAVAIVQCAAQQQTQPDRDAVKTTSEVIFVQPLTGGSNTSKITTNQLFLKSMNGLMSYDARISSATGMGPLRFPYGTTNPVTRVDARPWRLGIEEAERINLMQMNEYRWRNTTIPSSSTPETFYPSATERMFNAR